MAHGQAGIGHRVQMEGEVRDLSHNEGYVTSEFLHDVQRHVHGGDDHENDGGDDEMPLVKLL